MKCLQSLKLLSKGTTTLQRDKCFTVPTLFEICYKTQHLSVYFGKNNTIHEVKHQIMCCCVVFNVIQVEDNLQITHFTFNFDLTHIPAISDLGLCSWSNSGGYSSYCNLYRMPWV